MQFETAFRDETLTTIPSLPKGGGAIRGLGEAFRANPATGTASLSIPLPVSAARALTPGHQLRYDSGAGNGPFGLGWSVDLPRIARKADRALPTYDDLVDAFAFGGGELLPTLEEGAPVELDAQEGERKYRVRRYRPRVEGSFDRVELWRDISSGLTHWRVWSAGNTVSVFGQSVDARISDPDDPARVFSWHLERVFDGFGNLTLYTYRRDDDTGITSDDPHDGPRLGQSSAQLYPKSIFYGNRTPFAGILPDQTDFCFRTTFDYGETAPLAGLEDAGDWELRQDPFSRYRSGFEIRTRRLCSRVVTEHIFPEIGPTPECVRSLELTYGQSDLGQAQLQSVQMAGFTRSDQTRPYTVETLPALKLSYTEAALQTAVRKITDTGGSPLLTDTTGQDRWVDLSGDALPGLLTEANGGLIFRENLGGGVMGEAQTVGVQPSLSGLDTVLSVEDRQGRGAKQIVAQMAQLAGLYQTGHDDLPGQIAPFHGVETTTNLPSDENIRALDLTGDGLADRLYTVGEYLVWYRAAADGGFDIAQRVALPADANSGPAFLFSDAQGLTFLADMSGDGLLDVVCVAARGVRYWPNLGYGRFAPAVEMSAPPALAAEGELNADHLRLADVNGSGLTDILYFGSGEVTFWLNESGNGFGPPQRLDGVLPDSVGANEVAISDLLGQGTACLSWTGRASGPNQGERLYIDLYDGVKSGLLECVENGFGGKTELTYRPSTAYARDAAAAGQPWATRLHFPVHCLASTRVSDAVTGYSFATSYAYHHGYYDPDDREFRGFARVDQFDTESVVETGLSEQRRVFQQPTNLTRTWFHSGARLGNRSLEEALAAEYYAHGRLPLDPLPPELPTGLSDTDWAEAQRALKGGMLRRETYSLDDSDASEHPYSITLGQIRLVLHQPGQNLGDRYVQPVFQTMQRQSVNFTLDRNPDDPRVGQEITFDWDTWGNPLRGATISHGRWGETDTDTPQSVVPLQRRPMAAYAEQSLADAREPPGSIPAFLLDRVGRAAAVSFASTSWEARGVTLAPWVLTDPTTVEEQIAALPELVFTDHETLSGKRRIAAGRSFFAGADLSEPLPLGQTGPTGLVHHSEVLAFTPDCLEELYGDRLTDQDMTTAGYVREDPSGGWWSHSGTAIFDDAPQDRFYLPIGSRDAFGNESRVTFDAHFLAMTQAADALGNTTRLITDYRMLSPVLSRDANENWSAVSMNALGQPIAVAVMGKVAGVELPTGVEPCEGSTLDRPSAQFEYDLTAWEEGRGPARVTQTIFTELGSRTSGIRDTIVSHDYTDGLGNLAMTKAQQAPGPAQRLADDGTVEDVDTSTFAPPALRWLGNGRTILNNKGQPLRQFEPYFSTTPDYEDADALVEQGISNLPFYDAAGRSIGQLGPDGSWAKTRHTAWRTETWDAADTCLLDPRTDPELGAHFEGLPPNLYSENWVARRENDARGVEATRASELSAAHAETPAVSYLDAGGRAILATADNGEFGKITSHTLLDFEGNPLVVFDDRNRAVVTSRYNLLPPPDEETPKPALWQSSMDQGDTAAFFDCLGRPAMAWDAHGRMTRTSYDALSRPVEVWTEQTDGSVRRTALSIYGEGAPETEMRNLRGAVWKTFDTAGYAETGAHDFRGNVLHGYRRLLAITDASPHWPEADSDRVTMLSEETYRSETEYDGLGRPVRSALPYTGDAPTNLDFQGYDEGGGLAFVDAQIAGGSRKRYVEKITYDAKGQRQMIRFGNGVETRYTYDPETYRLARLLTTGPGGAVLQDLGYTYDIMGNVVAIGDATQPVIHHAGQVVAPVARYTYDALSRLLEATGREHIAQTGAPDWQTGAGAAGSVNDLEQMRTYTQFYSYDSTGNILSMRHVADGNSWTRHHGYEEASNRLAWTNIGATTAAGGDRFTYNVAGSMMSLPHLGAFELDAAEQMVEVDLGGGGRAFYTYDGGGARVRKRIERIGGAVEERLYLGGLEVYRKWVGGTLRLQRETVHISDDTGTIAMVETQTHTARGRIARPDRVERYQLANHLGSATLEVDEAGSLLTREESHPYGTTAFYAAAGGRALPPKRYRYTGQERDEETGLQHHGARYYAPWLARWTAADPIGIGDGLNVYAYVGGNPVGAVDPSGMNGEPSRDELAGRFMEMASTSPDVWRGITQEEAGLWADAWANRDNPDSFYAITDHLNWNFDDYNGAFSPMQYRMALARGGAAFAAYGEGSYAEAAFNATLATTAWVAYHTIVGDTYATTAGWTAFEMLGGRLLKGFYTVGRGAATRMAGPFMRAAEQAPAIAEMAAVKGPGLVQQAIAQVPDFAKMADNAIAGGPFPSEFVESSSATVHRIFFRNSDEVMAHFNLTSIADNPDLLRLWQQAIENKLGHHMFAKGTGLTNGGTGNAVGKFIYNSADGLPISKNLGKSAYGAVRSEFGRLVKEEFPDLVLGEVDHLFHKSQFSRYAIDPRWLVPTGSRAMHEMVHLIRSNGARNYWKSWSYMRDRFKPTSRTPTLP